MNWPSWWCLPLLGLFLAGGSLPAADDNARWRVYDRSDGLPDAFTSTVSVGPNDSLWATHLTGNRVSWLDGYSVRTIPSDEPDAFPICESASGQIWSLYLEGVAEYRNGRWVRYPIEEIREENRTSGLRRVQTIPLLPAERNHVLVLLPDRLMKFEPVTGGRLELRSASAVGLGRFTSLQAAREPGLWVAAERGVARVEDLVRRVSPETEWIRFPLPEGYRLHAQCRPFEDDRGRLWVVAETGELPQRSILVLTGAEWSEHLPGPEGARHVWLGSGDTVWTQARGRLLRWRDPDWEGVEIPTPGTAQVFDVAWETGGAFWLATSEGVVRHAPAPWSPVPELGGGFQTILQTDDRALWLVGNEGLKKFATNAWQTIPWPARFELAPAPGSGAFLLNDGRFAVGGMDHIAFYDPHADRFVLQALADDKLLIALLGCNSRGQVFAQAAPKESAGIGYVELVDDQGSQTFCEIKKGAALGDHFFRIVEMADGGLIVGASGGLGAWNAEAAEFQHLPGSGSGSVYTLLPFPDGQLWCGGQGTISRWNAGRWGSLRSGLGRIHSLRRAGDGNVMVAAQSGLYRYSQETWMSYGEAEALPMTPVTDALVAASGVTWAVTPLGVWRSFEGGDVDAPRTEIRLGQAGANFPTTDPLLVSFRGHDRWDMTPPDRLLYSYRLNSQPWSGFSETNQLSLPRLPPGDYRLSVRAMDRAWNEEAPPTEIGFAMFIPWYAELRIIVVGVLGLIVAAGLAGLAMNRHFRLLRSYAEVEQIVEQRTRELELANQELVHTQKMRALGVMAAGVAHDFNNVLSIIKGSAQIIERNLDDRDKIRIRVDRIRSMVEQGAGIVRALLGFSRGSIPRDARCDVRRVATDTLKQMRDQLGEQVVFRAKFPRELPDANCLGDALGQMLVNLVLNGVDAMNGRGEIRLTAGALEELPQHLPLRPRESSRYIYLAVSDQGYGIPEALVGRLFEPFFTTKALSSQPGTGLGLSMVYEIAKQMDLGLQVESTEGQGATFRIIIPVVETDAEPALGI